MMRLQVVSGDGQSVASFGPQVEFCDQAFLLAQTLQWMYECREMSYQEHQELPAVEWLPALDIYEGSSIQLVDTQSGHIYELTDKDEWEEIDPDRVMIRMAAGQS